MRLLLRWIQVLLCCASSMFGWQAAALKEKAVNIPIGDPVEVRLMPKGQERVKGQLASVTDSGVTIRTVENGQVRERPVAFDEMRSLDRKAGASKGVKALAWVGGIFLGLTVIGLLIGDR